MADNLIIGVGGGEDIDPIYQRHALEAEDPRPGPVVVQAATQSFTEARFVSFKWGVLETSLCHPLPSLMLIFHL